MKNSILMTVAMASAITCGAQTLSSDNIQDIVKAMTLEEKANLLVGSNRLIVTPPPLAPGMPVRPQPDWEKINKEKANSQPLAGIATNCTTGRVKGAAADNMLIARLGIPAIVLADGPAGLRIDPKRDGDTRTYYCTAFPTGNNLASTWNTALVESVTKVIGNEVREYGVDILLAPAMNLARNPLCGRNFEYFGEDPLLAGKIAAAYIRGVQSNGVGTSLKHFAVNNQETMRNGVNAVVTDRALREIYLRGFEIAVKEASPWTIMSSYNKINGVLASENRWLLTDLLRNEWGFQGLVMTDWWAEENGARQILAGNDLIMPGTQRQYDEIVAAVREGRLDERQLDWCVMNMLRLIVRTPTFANYAFSNTPDLTAHAEVARLAALESFVLLKNNGVLPLAKKQKVALFGVSSYDLLVGGSGSGNVNRAYKISLYEGLQNAGLKTDGATANRYLTYVRENKDESKENFWVVPVLEETAITDAEAWQAAKESDVALLTIGRMAGEGGDRQAVKGDYLLSDVESANLKTLCDAFHAKGKKVVVVLDMGSTIEMTDWNDMPDAILHAGLAGQEMGNALADVLTGKVSPSGRLTTTIARQYSDFSSANDFPMSQGIEGEVRYDEDVYVGYRHFTTRGIDPLYPFGFGLSYTTFSYSDLTAALEGDNLTATIRLTNTGKRAAKEVVELYVSAPQTDMAKPERELKAFAKTQTLKPGQSEVLTLTVPKHLLSSYSAFDQKWILSSGTYKVLVGASVTDIRQEATVKIE